MQKQLNLKVKFREGFRPFAPAVLAEEQAAWFDLDRPSPYMLLTAPVTAARRSALPADSAAQDLFEKLYTVRSSIPAVTHVDFSARLQTVTCDSNERFWQLLSAFRERTGCPVLVNTSFNVKDEPIVCTPEDAIGCFLATGIDALVMGDSLFTKEETIQQSC
jgi:carbamoyltransferase